GLVAHRRDPRTDSPAEGPSPLDQSEPRRTGPPRARRSLSEPEATRSTRIAPYSPSPEFAQRLGSGADLPASKAKSTSCAVPLPLFCPQLAPPPRKSRKAAIPFYG